MRTMTIQEFERLENPDAIVLDVYPKKKLIFGVLKNGKYCCFAGQGQGTVKLPKHSAKPLMDYFDQNNATLSPDEMLKYQNGTDSGYYYDIAFECTDQEVKDIMDFLKSGRYLIRII